MINAALARLLQTMHKEKLEYMSLRLVCTMRDDYCYNWMVHESLLRRRVNNVKRNRTSTDL